MKRIVVCAGGRGKRRGKPRVSERLRGAVLESAGSAWAVWVAGTVKSSPPVRATMFVSAVG